MFEIQEAEAIDRTNEGATEQDTVVHDQGLRRGPASGKLHGRDWNTIARNKSRIVGKETATGWQGGGDQDGEEADGEHAEQFELVGTGEEGDWWVDHQSQQWTQEQGLRCQGHPLPTHNR